MSLVHVWFCGVAYGSLCNIIVMCVVRVWYVCAIYVECVCVLHVWDCVCVICILCVVNCGRYLCGVCIMWLCVIILCYVMYVFVQSVGCVQNRCGVGVCIVSCLYLYMQCVWYM